MWWCLVLHSISIPNPQGAGRYTIYLLSDQYARSTYVFWQNLKSPCLLTIFQPLTMFTALTKTWFREQCDDAEVNIDGYRIFRQERNSQMTRNWGRENSGAALYIRNDLVGSAEVARNFSSGVIGMIGVKLKNQNLLIVVIYRQPHTNTNENDFTSGEYNQVTVALRRTLASLESHSPDIIFCGDFNLYNIV